MWIEVAKIETESPNVGFIIIYLAKVAMQQATNWKLRDYPLADHAHRSGDQRVSCMIVVLKGESLKNAFLPGPETEFPPETAKSQVYAEVPSGNLT